MEFIDLKAQYQAQRATIDARIRKVLEHGEFIMGPEVRELEERLAAFCGARHCVTVASGTEALLMALMAIGIRPGDEVITTPFSFIATAEVIVLLGAKPIFVDIEPDTCNINASLIEKKITSMTRAIMPVSLYGQPSDMDAINEIADTHGLVVIEDAAQSFGATYKDRKSCNLSTIGCTSFFPSKPLGCYGDGGAVFTSDDELAQAMREIRVHGQRERYVHSRIGVGGRMDTLQCAIVLAKMERLDWELRKRGEIGALYNELFGNRIRKISQRPDRSTVFAQYTIVVEDRKAVQSHLKELGIPTAVHYPLPIPRQPAYSAFDDGADSMVAIEMSRKVLSLPMGPYMSPDAVRRVVDAVLQIAEPG
jgi:UDP-2-acetamido-2-deoxy-ribo-hexuluronate aminotransferase